MTVIRYILLGFSILSALVLLVFWTVSGRAFDLVLFIVLAFLIANAFYVFISRSTMKTSDILVRASKGFALASLELEHHAQEAHIREVEAEKRRLADAEHNQFKLQVARDMLQHLRPKLLLDRRGEAQPAQITHQTNLKIDTLPLPAPVPPSPDDGRPAQGRDAMEKPVQSVVHPKPVPSSTILN